METEKLTPNQWKQLEEMLREETREHTRLLNLLQIQDKVIGQDNTEGLREISKAIDLQLEVINLLRQQRDEGVSRLARACNIQAGEELTDLLLFAPGEMQPGLTALLEESLAVLDSIQDKTRRNKARLAGKSRTEPAPARETEAAPAEESLAEIEAAPAEA